MPEEGSGYNNIVNFIMKREQMMPVSKAEEAMDFLKTPHGRHNHLDSVSYDSDNLFIDSQGENGSKRKENKQCIQTRLNGQN